MASYSFKKITDYTDAELGSAIEAAVEHCKAFGAKIAHIAPGMELDFYKLLNGIDAYMERRGRKAQSDYFARQGAKPPKEPKPRA